MNSISSHGAEVRSIRKLLLKINNMSKAMKMTPFLIKLLKEKQVKTNRKK